SGDTVVGQVKVGPAPVHVLQQTANQVLVVNQSVKGAISDSLTKITFSGPLISGTPITISLPPDSAPNFVASTEVGTAYVLLPHYVPDPVNFPDVVVPSVGVVNTSLNTLGPTIPVGDDPVAAIETLDGKNLYVANKGSGTVSNFNTVDRTPRNTTPIALSSPPLWISARSDSQRVYILESDGTIATLDTTATAGPDILTESSFSIP